MRPGKQPGAGALTRGSPLVACEHDGQYSRPPSQMTSWVPGQPAGLPVLSRGGPGGQCEGAEDRRAACGGRGLSAPARAGRRDRHREGEGRRVHPAPPAARRRPADVAGGGGPRAGQGDPGPGGQAIADGVELVVMESTSDYWRIWFYLLESAGLAVQPVNSSPRPAAGPLAEDGPARRPVDRAAGGDGPAAAVVGAAPEIRALRDLTRTRLQLVRDRTREWQRPFPLAPRAAKACPRLVTDSHGQISAGRRAAIEACLSGSRPHAQARRPHRTLAVPASAPGHRLRSAGAAARPSYPDATADPAPVQSCRPR